MPFFSLSATFLPLVVSCIAAAMICRVGGKRRGPALAEAGIGFGFLAGFVAITGGVPMVQNVTNHAVGTVTVIGLTVGVAASALGITARRLRGLAALAGLVIVGYLVGTDRLILFTGTAVIEALVFGAAGVAILLRLADLANRGAALALLLAIAAIGLALIAWIGHAISIAWLAQALAAALLGFLGWTWRDPRLKFGAAAVLAGGGTLLALGLTLAQTAQNLPWALLLLPPVFWADRFWVDRLMPGRTRAKRGAGKQSLRGKGKPSLPRLPFLTAAALVPMLSAVAAAWLLAQVGY
jgi:hypothetical protein